MKDLPKRCAAGNAAAIAIISAALLGMAQDASSQSWMQHYCVDDLVADMPMIGYQPSFDLEELTAFTGLAASAKVLFKPWSIPDDVVLYIYPLNMFIEPNDQSTLGNINAANVEWFHNVEDLAIVSGTPDQGYVGTPIQWTSDLEATFEAFVEAGVEVQSQTEQLDFADIALQLSFASGALVDEVVDGYELENVLALMPEQSNARDCSITTVIDSSQYDDLKDAWLEHGGYLATTEPIPGMTEVDRFIAQRDIWPRVSSGADM